MLTTFYGAMGTPPEAKGALALMATALAARAEPAAVNLALDRCMIECRFPVRLPDIFQRIPGTEAAEIDAEKRLAWEIVEKFVGKWLRWDGDDRVHARIEQGAPELAPRVVDAVRRSGGWSAYLRMTDGDFPHIQRRFFEEYSTWTQVEKITDRARLLEMPRVKELAAAKGFERNSAATQKPPAVAPEKPRSPQMAHIMKQIDKLRRRT
jgi:hypothetical protein